MKRLLFFICTLLCANVLMAQTRFIVGELQYEVTGTNKVEVHDCMPSATSIVIPNTVTYQETNYSVTKIGNDAFEDCSSLTSVTIPNSVTSIGNYAFHRCSSLTSIDIPNSVNTIGQSAFRDCSSLTSVTIGNSVTSIGDDAFYNCSSLTYVTIPNSVTSIGWDAFRNCDGLTSVDIPNSVTSIRGRAFYGCSSLTSIDIPNSVTSIGNGAFAYCLSLTSVTLPQNATIENNAFYDAGTKITIDSITYRKTTASLMVGFNNFSNVGFTSFYLGDNIYRNPATDMYVNDCDTNKSGEVIIPSAIEINDIEYPVTSIGYPAFSSCDYLTSVTIPNSVTIIDGFAFHSCSSLTSVTIGNSVTSIGEYTFEGCRSLTSVTCLAETAPTLEGLSSFVFAYTPSTKTLTVPCESDYSAWESATTWASVERIGCEEEECVDVFTIGDLTYEKTSATEVSVKDCDSTATEVIIPASVEQCGITYSVTSIGDNAFEGCSNLTSIDIPNSVTSIGNSAFRNSSSLTSITIPNSVTSIGNSAFQSCSSLTSITIPNSVTSIGDGAFNGCSNLTSIDIPNSITSIGTSTFSGCSSLTSITIPNSVTSIAGLVFSNCSSLTSVTIGNGVTFIGMWAFSGCSGLDSITCLAETAPSLGSAAFSGTPSTKVLNIPCGSNYSSWESATDWASVECTLDLGNSLTYFPLTFAIISEEERTMKVSDCDVSATDVEIPARVMYNGELYDVTSIGSNAFEDCNSLTSVTIPNSVTSIGDYAFYGCSSLTSIDIPNSVTSIGIWAFEYCSSLTSVTIPNSVTSIGYQMFAYCSSLTSVTIPNSVTSIAVAAFSGCSSLTSVNIPNSVTSIGGSAFYKCSSLTSIDIPNSVTSIGSGAFEYCSSLTSVILPNNANISSDAFKNTGGINVGGIYYGGKETVNVGNYTFNNVGFITFYLNGNATTITPSEVSVIDCDESLSGDIVIPSILSYQEANYSVTSIVDYAFRYCSSLTSVTIPNSVTSIGSHAFCDCSSLTSVTIPNSVTSIRNFTFYDCSSLTSVTCLAETAPSLGSYVFSFTPSTKTLTYPCGSDYSTWQSATTWASVECIDIYVDLGNSLTYFPLTFEIISEEERTMKVSDCDVSVTDVEIPARVMYNGELYDVTSIGYRAFCNCSSLTSIDIPNSVTSIKQCAFANCSSLTSVTIPNSVTAIGLQAFEDCSSLTSVTIPNSVDTIGGYAFKDCSSLTSINIPNSVTYIGGAAFANCSSLTSITIPNSVTSIYAGTFEYCSSLTSVTLPENITYIVSNAFYKAGVNASVVIDSVTYKVSATIPGYNIHGCGLITFHIGDSTYAPTEAMVYGCYQSRNGHVDILSSIEIAGNTYSVTSIGDYAFRNCSSLTSVTIPNSITYIGNDAFRDCSSLTTINFNAINCEDFAPSYPPFDDCPISTINIGGSVQRIPGYFIGSYFYLTPSSLTSITIPNSVTSIGEYAFYGCNLDSITCLAETAPSLGSSAFSGTPSTKTLTVPFGSNYSAWEEASTWQKVYYLIQEGEEKELASDFTITEVRKIKNNGVLRIKPTGQLINETSTNVSGVFEIETPTLPNDKWSFVGAPFNGYKLEAIKEGTRDVAVSVFDYDSADWSEEFATIETPIRKGEGFLLWSFAEEATVFTTNPENPSEEYTLNNGGVSVTETLTTHEGEGGGNWMALANPYTFKLDIAKFLQDQSDVNESDVKGGCVYRLNGVSWEEVKEGVIGLTEGFFVNYANPGSQTATFVKSHRYTGTSSKAEKKKEYIKLYMNDGERISKLSIAQNEEASQGDDIFDANKLFSPFEIAEPYFLTEGVALVKEEVKTLPYTATLNVKSYESKEVTFSVGDIPEDYNVYLIDNGFDIKMNDGVEYNTRIVAGENADRFKVLFKKAHRLTETVNKDIYVNNFNREVRISSTQKDLKIEVYDALGRKVFETKDYKFELNQVPAGAYMVKVYNRFARKDAKIVLN